MNYALYLFLAMTPVTMTISAASNQAKKGSTPAPHTNIISITDITEQFEKERRNQGHRELRAGFHTKKSRQSFTPNTIESYRSKRTTNISPNSREVHTFKEEWCMSDEDQSDKSHSSDDDQSSTSNSDSDTASHSKDEYSYLDNYEFCSDDENESDSDQSSSGEEGPDSDNDDPNKSSDDSDKDEWKDLREYVYNHDEA